jgi:hypothetical protein
MRKNGALGEVALPGKYQRFMENRQFLAELPTDHEPQRVFTTGTETRRWSEDAFLLRASGPLW